MTDPRQVGPPVDAQAVLSPLTGAAIFLVATVDDGAGHTMPNLSGYADLNADGQSHVTSIIGNFTADTTSQAVNVVLSGDRNSGISALRSPNEVDNARRRPAFTCARTDVAVPFMTCTRPDSRSVIASATLTNASQRLAAKCSQRRKNSRAPLPWYG